MTAVTFDPAAKNARITLSGGNLVATCSNAGVGQSARATTFNTAGKLYAEFLVTVASGSAAVGIATSAGTLADGTAMFSDANGYGYYTDGRKGTGGVLSAYGASFTVGDRLSVVLDLDAGTLSFWKNGADQGVAFTGISGSYALEISGATNEVFTANFGASAFTYTPPAGYGGWDVLPPTPGDGEVTSEPMTAYGARLAAGAVTAEAMTAVGGFNGFGTCVTGAMTASASGGNNSAAVTMEPMTAVVTGHAEHRAAVTMAAMTVAATGYDSSINTFAGTAPAPTLSSTSLIGNIITVTGSASAPLLVATLQSEVLLSAALTAPASRLSAQLLRGNVATFLGTAAAPTMSAAGYPAYTLTFAGTAPAPRLTATLSAAVTAAFRTWCLNTKRGALTEYGSEWAMNSYAFFNGKFLGCTSSGIVELGTQALDNATAIDSTVKSGKDNFGTSVIKRLPRLYVDYTTGGDAQFKLITTEGGSRTYALQWNNVTGTQQRRVPIGKGPKSVRWQWEYTNVDGADFDLGAVLAYPQKLRRRAQ